jgi:hypothetical protein
MGEEEEMLKQAMLMSESEERARESLINKNQGESQ